MPDITLAVRAMGHAESAAVGRRYVIADRGDTLLTITKGQDAVQVLLPVRSALKLAALIAATAVRQLLRPKE